MNIAISDDSIDYSLNQYSSQLHVGIQLPLSNNQLGREAPGKWASEAGSRGWVQALGTLSYGMTSGGQEEPFRRALF